MHAKSDLRRRAIDPEAVRSAARRPQLRKARAWFVASFKPKTLSDLKALCPPGSDENASYRMVATYWEMVASFVTSGVLNKELFFESGRELLLVWERLRDVVPAIREDFKDPRTTTPTLKRSRRTTSNTSATAGQTPTRLSRRESGTDDCPCLVLSAACQVRCLVPGAKCGATLPSIAHRARRTSTALSTKHQARGTRHRTKHEAQSTQHRTRHLAPST